MNRRPLLVGAPQHYPLRPDSVVGGEIYERELLRPRHRARDHGMLAPSDELARAFEPGQLFALDW